MNPINPLAHHLARLVARRINQHTAAEASPLRSQFARYASQHLALQIKSKQYAVWRINARGEWVAVSPLIDADAIVQWDSVENGVTISGNAGLLKVLSECQQSLDIPVLVVESFGPTLAPHLFYAWQAARQRQSMWCSNELITPAEAAEQQHRAAALQKRFTRLLKKVEQIEHTLKITQST